MIKYLDLILYGVLFYDALIVLALPSSVVFIATTDGSPARMSAYLAAMAIAGLALCTVGFKRLPATSLLWLLGFIVFSSFHCPDLNFTTTFMPKDSGLFNFKPMFECIIFFALFMGMYSLPLTRETYERIVKALAISGIIISVYIILQRLGMDQIYRLTDGQAIQHLSRNPQAGGFISQPVFAAAMLVMLLPFMMRMHFGWAVLCLTAIILTGNRTGMLCAGITGLYFFTWHRMIVYQVIGLYVAIVALMLGLYWWHPEFIDNLTHPSGRLEAWKMMIEDFISPKFPGIDKSYVLTGQGIGGFGTFFPFYNHSSFQQAHNEYLELWRGCSFIGLFLFLKSQWQILKMIERNHIFISLLCISLFALTNAVWHNPTLAFLTAFLAGLGCNSSNVKPEVVPCTTLIQDA